MAGMSDYLENKLIDNIFRATSYTGPTNIYLALFTTATTDAGGGTEVSAGGYSRQQLDPSDTNWTATQGGTSGASSGTGGETTNASEITFGPASASWGTVTHFAVMDASTSGNMLFHGKLRRSKAVANGNSVKFAVGDIAIKLA